MKCLILLSLATFSLAAVVPFGAQYPHFLHGGYDPEHVYGYGHIPVSGYPHVAPIHEQVLQEHPIGHVSGYEVDHQVVAKDYGLEHYPIVHHPINVHEKVVEEHPIGQVEGHHIAEQIVVKDPVATHYQGQYLHPEVQGQYVHPFLSYHSQYPYGFLNTAYGQHYFGQYYPHLIQQGVHGYYNPLVHHYF